MTEHDVAEKKGIREHQSTIVIAAAVVVDDEKEWYLLDRTSYLSLNYAHNSTQDISILMPVNSSKRCLLLVFIWKCARVHTHTHIQYITVPLWIRVCVCMFLLTIINWIFHKAIWICTVGFRWLPSWLNRLWSMNVCVCLCASFSFACRLSLSLAKLWIST